MLARHIVLPKWKVQLISSFVLAVTMLVLVNGTVKDPLQSRTHSQNSWSSLVDEQLLAFISDSRGSAHKSW